MLVLMLTLMLMLKETSLLLFVSSVLQGANYLSSFGGVSILTRMVMTDVAESAPVFISSNGGVVVEAMVRFHFETETAPSLPRSA